VGDAYGYLVAAYAVFWVLTFGMLAATTARQRRLDREIESLEAEVALVRERAVPRPDDDT
jgi:CcmD family protein